MAYQITARVVGRSENPRGGGNFTPWLKLKIGLIDWPNILSVFTDGWMAAPIK